jgi:hypothetical protein
MWSDVGKLYRKVRANIVQAYVLDTLSASYACSEEESAALAEQSEQQLSQLIRLIVEQHTGMISLHMRSKFDSLFRYDSGGRIRKWGARDNIRAVFKQARDETLQLLDLFAIFRLDEYKEADSPANLRAQALRDEEEAAKKQKKGGALPASAAAGSGRRPSLMRTASSDKNNAVNSPSSSSSSSTLDTVAESKEASEEAGEEDEDGFLRSGDEEDEVEDEEEDRVGRTTIDYASEDASNILLDAQARLEKETSFRFDIEGALREAEIQQQANEERTKIPWWMVALVCFLGMDEILALLRNPFLLVFLLLVGGAAFVAHQAGMLWPALTVAKAVAAQFIQQAQSTLLQPPQQQQAGAMPPSTRRMSSLERRNSQMQADSFTNLTSSTTPRGMVSGEGRRGSAMDGLSRRYQAAAAASNDDGEQSVEMADLSPSVDVSEVKFHLASERRGSANNSNATLASGASAAAAPVRRTSSINTAGAKRGSVVQ